MLAECEVKPEVFDGITERLMEFAEPYLDSFCRNEQKQHAQRYLGGLLSEVARKNAESIAYHYDEGRKGLQHFLGSSPWDERPLVSVLVRQVGEDLAEEDGVLVFDPSGFPKKGNHSVGVARQWCGRLDKVDNCQVGVYLAYASRQEYALVDVRLYLPETWAEDGERRGACGIPEELEFQTRHQLALEMLAEHGERLPHAWITGDDEMGRPIDFRRELRGLNEQYLLAVPSNTNIRDLEATPPPWSGRGGKPKAPFQRVDRWRALRSDPDWTELEVRDGEKGPLRVEVTHTRVVVRQEGRVEQTEEVLVVIRTFEADGQTKHDYYLSNASAETPRAEFARVAKAEHRVEDSLKRAKGEAGLADYEIRTWRGWHHHQALSLVATWFLTREARRGQQLTPAITVPQIRVGLAALLYQASGPITGERLSRYAQRRLVRNEMARFYHWKGSQRLAPLRVEQRR